ncbi:hypothetical protein [Roseibacillus persicicus]|uniref:hypothetical protein n=1 Tax=Roseibacillus persicicus TaxID=454148 RepID=UPI00280CB386|nr:hypothetical protein [Roseibacillus persicicus]MDQ8192254.1 hypothetical protein [Roseibacillus persicicus]
MTSRLTGGMLLASTAFLWAGDATYEEAPVVSPAPVEASSGGFCDAYKNIGKLYSDETNPIIQSFSVFGRIHYQYGYTDGVDANGDNFNYESDEIRRFRVGAKMGLLNYFELKGQAEIFNDQEPAGGDRNFEFKHMWDLTLTFDAKDAFGIEAVDGLKFGYGKRETHTSAEWDISSNSIKTVERSAISNKVWPSATEFDNATGGWVDIKSGNFRTELGVFSTTQDDYIAGWDDGIMYWANAWYDISSMTGADISKVYFAGFYQDIDANDEDLGGGMEWSTSLSLTYGRGPWQFILEGIYADNGDQAADRDGNVWGVVFLPSMFIIEDKLEAVARYQYQGSSEDEGIRLNSRYARRAESVGDADLDGARGDAHHSFYAGLNYYFCPSTKVMAGIEYDDIESNGDHVYEGWTTFLGFRTYF